MQYGFSHQALEVTLIRPNGWTASCTGPKLSSVLKELDILVDPTGPTMPFFSRCAFRQKLVGPFDRRTVPAQCEVSKARSIAIPGSRGILG